jgi:hypothetical protein
MVAVPAPKAVMVPSLLIVNTAVLSELYETGRLLVAIADKL